MNPRETRMATANIPSLILRMSLPMVISMLVLALYNVVDSVFLSMTPEGDSYLAALSLAFPFQMLTVGIGIGTAVGTCSLVSRKLGEGDRLGADMTATNGMMLAFLSGLVTLAVGLTLSGACIGIVNGQGGNVSDATLAYGTDYLRICMSFSMFLMIQAMSEKLLQSCGHMVLAMLTQIAGAVVNIVLDPILIFGLLGFPAMGVKGAAIATVAGQFVGMLLGFMLMRGHATVKLRFTVQAEVDGRARRRLFKPSGSIVRGIYAVGLPSIVMQSIGSVTNLCMNSILVTFSESAVTVLGLYFKIHSFVFMPVFGLNSGTMPILAYNYGAGNGVRVKKTLYTGICYALVVMLAGFALFQLMPQQLLSLFNVGDEIMRIGTQAFRTISICFPFAGICIMCGTLFQAIGKGVFSLAVTACRQLIVIIPAALILATVTKDVMAVWYAYPLAEIMSLSVSLIFVTRTIRRNINNLKPRTEDNILNAPVESA
ncbi:MAG: MATE family efflux transporter [Clostridia bacterium]|nr:MATE family efflux transporter [Clostridia bacterium]